MPTIMQCRCGQCGKVFERQLKHVNTNKKRGEIGYCSVECVHTSQIKRVLLECAGCGKQIERRPKEDSKSGRFFCSRSCCNQFNNRQRMGKDHPGWNNGIGSYRQRALLFYGERCTVCGYGIREVLEVHHRDGDREHNEIENLDVLCPTHHVEFERGIRSYPAVSVNDRPTGSDPVDAGLTPAAASKLLQ